MMTMKSISEILNTRNPKPLKPKSFEGLPIRPKGKKTRFWIDNEYFEGGYAAAFPRTTLVVYGILAMHANADTQQCFPAIKRIMKLGRLTNRRTVFDDIRLLEAFDIIAVEHSKGRKSNRYLLLDSSKWKPANSGMVETIRKTRKRRPTVAANPSQPSQTTPDNSGTDETRNHMSESDKEIKAANKKEISEEEVKSSALAEKQSLSQASMTALRVFYEEADILKAIAFLQGENIETTFFRAVKKRLQQWSAEGKITAKKEMSW